MIGTLDALYWMMKGGVVPGGSERSWTWLIAVQLRHRLRNVHVRLEEDLDDAHAHQRLRLNVINVVDRRRHAAFGVGHNSVGHLVGRKTLVAPHHRRHRNIDVAGKMSVGIDAMLKTPRIRIRSAKTTNV